MVDSTDNVVLEHLRHIRARLDKIEDKVDTAILRLGIIEGHVAGFHVSEASQNLELDRVKARVDRIEKRLELTD